MLTKGKKHASSHAVHVYMYHYTLTLKYDRTRVIYSKAYLVSEHRLEGQRSGPDPLPQGTISATS